MTDWQRIGRVSRGKGKRKQRLVRKFLEALSGVPSPVGVDINRMGDEEAWTHIPIRVECKAGAQISPMMTRFSAAEMQHYEQEDNRPFMMAICPDGTSHTYFMMVDTDLARICEIYHGRFDR